MKISSRSANAIYWASFIVRRVVIVSSIFWALLAAIVPMWGAFIFFSLFATFLILTADFGDAQMRKLLDLPVPPED